MRTEPRTVPSGRSDPLPRTAGSRYANGFHAGSWSSPGGCSGIDKTNVLRHGLAQLPNSPRSAPNAVRFIDVLTYPAVQLLDVTGPVQVFASANDSSPKREERGLIAGGRGARRPGRHRLGRPRDRSRAAPTNRRRIRYPPGRRRRGRRGSGGGPGAGRLGAGAGDAGAAGRLRLHRGVPARRCGRAGWASRGDPLDVLRQAAQRFPAVRVEPDPIFVCDGPGWTSAGVTAGIDLALALVKKTWAAPWRSPWRAISSSSSSARRTGAVQRCLVLASGRRQIRSAP